jgi:hypothetical protein
MAQDLRTGPLASRGDAVTAEPTHRPAPIYDLTPGSQGSVLDVGCGAAKTPGAVGLDISADTDADVVHDLDEFPYPLETASFDHVLTARSWFTSVSGATGASTWPASPSPEGPTS